MFDIFFDNLLKTRDTIKIDSIDSIKSEEIQLESIIFG